MYCRLTKIAFIAVQTIIIILIFTSLHLKQHLFKIQLEFFFINLIASISLSNFTTLNILNGIFNAFYREKKQLTFGNLKKCMYPTF